ncbi:hypothetical protein D5085_02780 [Ectothiorhodospiraceae bacterium BW-2]|nr:hypothetical protein D5085_02780 [Ectothiorhodospiraceae bacterium BW-2]
MSWHDWAEYTPPDSLTPDGAPFAAEIVPFEPIPQQIKRLLSDLPLLADDKRYIDAQCKRLGLNSQRRELLLQQYRQKWEQAAALEPIDFRQDNASRRAANLWLLDLEADR